jgi:hypothetical protein
MGAASYGKVGRMAEKDEQEISLTWELTCRDCKSRFEVPVPSGPLEEKELKCLTCGSESLDRVEATVSGEPACGG